MWARFLFAIVWFLFAILMVNQQVLLLFTLLTLVILFLQTHSLKLLIRSFRLLMWLFIPIVLLHGFFTPGTYIMGLPLSVEGLQQAVGLMLNLVCMFFTALLVMKILKMEHLLCVLNNHAVFQRTMLPSLLLLSRLRILIPQVLNQQLIHWQRLTHKWLLLPDVLFESMLLVLQSSRHEAQLLWENWGEEVDKLMMAGCDAKKNTATDFVFGILALFALTGLWLW